MCQIYYDELRLPTAAKLGCMNGGQCNGGSRRCQKNKRNRMIKELRSLDITQSKSPVTIVSKPSKCLKFMTFREGCFSHTQLNASA